MIWILLSIFQSNYNVNDQYSLIPPFSYTNLSEINDWTIRGSAANMKKYFRLTYDIPNSFGGVCHRVPTRFKDWIIEIEISAKEGNSGEGFYFFFTKECCPDLNSRFTGFEIWINTGLTNRSGHSPIYFFNNFNNEQFERSDIKSIGSAVVRKINSPFILRIIRQNNLIQIETPAANSRQTIFSINTTKIIDYGYLSFYANTTTKTDKNDLFSIRTIPTSVSLKGESIIDYSSVNRKMLQDNVITRRIMKKRRRSKMSTAIKYGELVEENEGKLTGETQSLKDAFLIIKESDLRNQETVNVNSLKKFIDGTIDSTIKKASKMIEMASMKFDETKIDMNDVWSYLKTQLIDLSVESNKELKEMREEALQYAREIKLSNVDPIKIKRNIHLLEKDNNIDSFISKILILICFIEFIAYIIFIMIQRKKTHGFKKAD
ncbi:hypothetical protein M9Y10_025572 [Tritrichomonas musculus]|uniref:L-type lectin-like domain-containing protein n=1 Tax=Tritrichomonas musculus TaxID=1915356 RepID=A0ABR2H976_9EUKA